MGGSFLNKIVLIGNLGGDPEIRSTNDGKEIATFSLATSETWKDKITGEKKNKTEWHRVVVFIDGLVKIIKNYVKKGTKLYIEGQLQTRKWINNENQERYTTEIVLQNFNSNLILLDSRIGSTVDDQPGGGRISQNNTPTFNNSDLDDEIPF